MIRVAKEFFLGERFIGFNLEKYYQVAWETVWTWVNAYYCTYKVSTCDGKEQPRFVTPAVSRFPPP